MQWLCFFFRNNDNDSVGSGNDSGDITVSGNKCCDLLLLLLLLLLFWLFIDFRKMFSLINMLSSYIKKYEKYFSSKKKKKRVLFQKNLRLKFYFKRHLITLGRIFFHQFYLVNNSKCLQKSYNTNLKNKRKKIYLHFHV